MKLLTLDVGDTTGWAAFLDETFVSGGTFNGLLESVPQDLKNWRREDLVVIERPLMRFSQRWQPLLDDITSQFPRHRFVMPGTWKPRWDKAELPVGRLLRTQHEKDAYRIGLWALNEIKAGRLS